MLSYLDIKSKNIKDEEWNQLWLVSDIIFDKDYARISWIVYKTGIISYDFFNVSDILENDDIIKIKKNENKDNINENYNIIWKIVKNKSEKKLGTVEDIEFDEIWWILETLIISLWFDLSSIELREASISIRKEIRKIPKKKILSFEENYIIIEDNSIIKEEKKYLENLSKIFINVANQSYTLNKIVWQENTKKS